MTTNYTDEKVFTDEIHLYTSEVLMLFAGKKITSATPCSALIDRKSKKRDGIVIAVEGVNKPDGTPLKVGFISWEIGIPMVQHYLSEDKAVPMPTQSLLSNATLNAKLVCNGDKTTYYQSICDAIVGKISGYHLSTGKNTVTKKLYPAYTWIVVDSADKAIVDITKEEKKEAE